MAEKTEDKKQEFEDVKKTVEAHGDISEKASEEKAKASEKVAKELVEGEIKKETTQEKAEAEKKFAAEEGKDKEKQEEKPRERRGRFREPTREELISGWEPKTKLGREVKDNKIKSIDEILDSGRKILEEQIVDSLLEVKTDLVSIGQSKGKFGGGKRRAWRQTQKKTKEGNVAVFSTMAVVGDGAGHLGIGVGKAKETLPARDKATRKAKLNIIKIRRTCSGFDCSCDELHTVPFKVTGKSGSVKIELIPAAQGTGLVVGNELKKILKLAGIKDVYSKTFGKKRTTFNLVKACFEALKKTNEGGSKK